MEKDERARWLFPRREGTVEGTHTGTDLADLDPDDPDDRHSLVLADHPELQAAIRDDAGEIEVGGEPMSPTLHIGFHVVVANQILDDDPPEVWLAAQRLEGLGYDRHEILHMLAGAAAQQTWSAMAERRPYDRTQHLADLDALPASWEAERPRGRASTAQARPRPRPPRRRKESGRKRKRR